jgi:hypothetical protein
MALGGGMMKRQDPQQQITVYIDVPSVDEYVDKVKKLGGKWSFQKQLYLIWVISPSVLIRKTTASVFGRTTPRQSNRFTVHRFSLP